MAYRQSSINRNIKFALFFNTNSKHFIVTKTFFLHDECLLTIRYTYFVFAYLRLRIQANDLLESNLLLLLLLQEIYINVLTIESAN